MKNVINDEFQKKTEIFNLFKCFFFRKFFRRFIFNEMSQFNVKIFNIQNIINQIVQKFYDTMFNQQRNKRQSFDSIIENDIANSNDEKNEKKNDDNVKKLSTTYYITKSKHNFFIFFRQKQRNKIVLKNSND